MVASVTAVARHVTSGQAVHDLVAAAYDVGFDLI
jgi:hypothetical protein